MVGTRRNEKNILQEKPQRGGNHYGVGGNWEIRCIVKWED